jgi:hypothetical protein
VFNAMQPLDMAGEQRAEDVPAPATRDVHSSAESRLSTKKRCHGMWPMPTAIGNAVRRPQAKRMARMIMSGWCSIRSGAR